MSEQLQHEEPLERRLNESYSKCPRYEQHKLSEDQIVAIAKKAVQLAKEESDMEVGRLTKKGLRYVAGTLAIGLYIWAVQQGIIEVGK
jgi:hypothetical protein